MITELLLPVKNEKGEVVKQVKANTFNIKFGTIEKLMELLDIDEDMSSFDILKKVTCVWGEIVKILSEIFPEMNEEDWENVSLNDLLPIVLSVVKYTFFNIMEIPSDPKN